MSISNMANRRITVKRKTAFVLDATTALASIDTDRQPNVGSFIEAELSGGTSNTGTVTVSGAVDGAPDTEVLTFTGAGKQTTVLRFDSLDASGTFVTTGLTDEPTVPTIAVRAVGSGGDPHPQHVDVVTDWPARFDRGRATWPAPTAGSSQLEKTRFYVDFNTVWEPKDGDVIIDQRDSQEYFVQGNPNQADGSGTLVPHHWEIEVKRREGSV